MQVTKEQIDPCTVALDIKIEPEIISKAFGQAYREFGQFTNVPGFRPGKAPRKMVERYVNQEKLRERVMEIVAGPAYRDALKQEEITPFTDPEVDFSDLADGQEWQFKAVVPLPPQTTLGDYSDLAVERPVYTVSDEDVDKQVEGLRNEHTRLEKVEGRGVQEGDVLIAEMSIQMEGEETPSEPKRSLIRVGDNIPGFDEAILGQQVDEERTFTLTYPEDHQEPEKAGKQGTFTIKVASISQRVLPEVTDEWVSGITPYATLPELREAIREAQTAQFKDLADRVTESRILEGLIQRSTIQYPEVMVQQEMQDEAHDLSHEMENRQMDYEGYLAATGQTEEQHREQLRKNAIERVQSVLVLRELAKDLNIQYSNEELAAEFARIAMENQMSEDDARRFLRDEQRRTQVINLIIRRKIRDHLFDTIKITDAPASA